MNSNNKKVEVEFDAVRDGDVIRIMTENSSYEFVVTDSRTRRGLLTGGALGDRQLNASSTSLLHEGDSARFLVRLEMTHCRVVTSAVKDLVLIRNSEDEAGLPIDLPSSNTEVQTCAP